MLFDDKTLLLLETLVTTCLVVMMAGAAMDNCLYPLQMESGTDAKAFSRVHQMMTLSTNDLTSNIHSESSISDRLACAMNRRLWWREPAFDVQTPDEADGNDSRKGKPIS